MKRKRENIGNDRIVLMEDILAHSCVMIWIGAPCPLSTRETHVQYLLLFDLMHRRPAYGIPNDHSTVPQAVGAFENDR
jgi:hypothetical protein